MMLLFRIFVQLSAEQKKFFTQTPFKSVFHYHFPLAQGSNALVYNPSLVWNGIDIQLCPQIFFKTS